MPIATIQLPNGKIADIEVPQGATPQEIESFVMSNPELGGQQPQPAPQPQTQPMQSLAELEQIAGKNQTYLQENLPASQGIVGLETVENVGRGINIGLGNAAVGAFQAATDVGEKAASLIERLYFGDNLNMDTIGNRLANQVKQRNELQAQLPTSQRVGVAIGQSLPYLATGVGTGAKVAQTAGKVAGLASGGAVSGAVSSALSPQEQASLGNRAVETVKGGAIGGAVGAGFGVAEKVASSAVTLGKDILAGFKARPVEAIAGFTSKPVETLDSISEAIKEGSTNAYKAMRESGAIFKPETTKSIFTGIDDALKENGILNPRLHGDTIGILEDLKALAKEKNGAIGLEELDQYRQLLGDVVKKNTDISGKINADALKANIAINKLDDVVEGLGGNALEGQGQILYRGTNSSQSIGGKVLSTSKNPEVAKNFSDNGSIKKFILDKNAKIIDISELRKQILKVDKLPNPTTLSKEQFDSITGESLVKEARRLGYDVIDQSKIGFKSKGINPNRPSLDEEEFKIINSKVLKEANEESQNSLDLLNTAREEWKRYRKFDAISSIVKKADGDPNRTKTLLQNFVNNPKNLRGFSTAEIQALKRAKTNSTAEGLMKAVGKFGFDIGSGRNAGNSALPIGSILIGGGTGGLTALVGTVARQAQKLSAKGQIDDVLKLIQGQEPQVASKVIQQLSPKTRDFVLTNILTQTINKSINQ